MISTADAIDETKNEETKKSCFFPCGCRLTRSLLLGKRKVTTLGRLVRRSVIAKMGKSEIMEHCVCSDNPVERNRENRDCRGYYNIYKKYIK